jgi:cysteine desulfurase/selenocysteine lyase
MEEIARHEQEIARTALNSWKPAGGIKVIGPRAGRGGVLAFELEGIHPHDIARYWTVKESPSGWTSLRSANCT